MKLQGKLPKWLGHRRVRVTSTGCWEWVGATNKKGYAIVGSGKKKVRRVHRVIFECTRNVKLHPSTLITHRCDNPPCVRPSHLSQGTPASNTREMMERGRQIPSSRTHLDESQIKVIRQAHSKRQVTVSELASRYEVSRSTIDNIISRRTWRHVQ